MCEEVVHCTVVVCGTGSDVLCSVLMAGLLYNMCVLVALISMAVQIHIMIIITVLSRYMRGLYQYFTIKIII